MIKTRLAVPAMFVGLFFLLAPSVGAQTGYFRVEPREGVWWLIDPDGRPTLSMGVNHIRYAPDKVRGTGPSLYEAAVKKIYPDPNTWALRTLARLRMWGFNTIAAWSDPDLWDHKVPYTVILDIAESAGADWQHGKPVDVYDPKFETSAREITQKMCAPRAPDRYLIGYFSDNELRWGPDWRGKETMLEMYLKLSAAAPGRQAAIEFLRERYGGEIANLNAAWKISASDFEGALPITPTEAFKADADEFLSRVAMRYFEVCLRAIKSADPNHLYLGARFAGGVPDAVIRAAKVLDVVSVNIYDFDPRPMARKVIALTGRPIMETEFSFRGQDAGLPNTRGAGPRVPDQRARALAFTDYVTRLLSLPEAVGYHWFQWSDQPKEGRFDGENSNYGLVDINDKPYGEFVEVVRSTNLAAVEVHKKAGR